VAKATTSNSKQLAECQEEVAALKHGLPENSDAIRSDDPLLNSGLRLAMENAALRAKVAELIDEIAETKADSVVETSTTI
jgi:hypothetical protein